MSKINLVLKTEGKTKLYVPNPKKYKIPENAPVFYNPRFETDRNISVLILKTFFGKRKVNIADVLSGIGVRAIRYANEAGLEAYANDVQPSAVKLIKKNSKLNNVKIKISNMEANKFLIEHKNNRFNCIDIDPFGSPITFLNSAMLAIKPRKSLLCISATDLGALSGIYPRACFRKYFTTAGRTSFNHELGIRNLLMVIFREASKYGFSIKPLLAYHNIHYYRAYCEMVGSKTETSKDIKKIGYIAYCKKCERREVYDAKNVDLNCKCGNKMMLLGPTWIGKIADKKFLEKVLVKSSDKEVSRILSLVRKEADIVTPYYDLHILSRVYKKSLKKNEIIEKTKGSETHFCGHGIKTNVSFDVLRNYIKKKI